MALEKNDEVQDGFEPTLAADLPHLADCLKHHLGPSLVAIYVFGSGGMEDFHPGASDLDILAIASRTLPQPEKQVLASALVALPLPDHFKGLDFLLIQEGATDQFELSVAAGLHWDTEIEFGGQYDGLPLDLATCRQSGIPLFGPPPQDLIAPIAPDLLRTLMAQEVAWHRDHILDPFHDPHGLNSTLNACRAWSFVETGKMMSKTEGAKWCLQQPELGAFRDLISKVLQDRQNPAPQDPDPSTISAWLEFVLQRLA